MPMGRDVRSRLLLHLPAASECQDKKNICIRSRRNQEQPWEKNMPIGSPVELTLGTRSNGRTAGLSTSTRLHGLKALLSVNGDPPTFNNLRPDLDVPSLTTNQKKSKLQPQIPATLTFDPEEFNEDHTATRTGGR